MKQVVLWSLILVIVFVLFIGIAFGVLSYLTPSEEELEKMQKAAEKKETVAKTQMDSDSGTEASSDTSLAPRDTNKISPVDSMQILIDSLNSELFFYKIRFDSLSDESTQQLADIEGLNKSISDYETQIQDLQNHAIEVKELAKTYETMKVNDIRPIIEKVDDETVIALYRNMSGRTRKNIIQALSSVRAAQITKKIARMSS